MWFAIALWLLAACRPNFSPAGILPSAVAPQTPEPAADFDFPLDPSHYGPYLPFQSGPQPVDTRFGAQNPGVGQDGKCFIDEDGNKVPFDELYHAGEDWFFHEAGDIANGSRGAGAPVCAIANGVVTWQESLGSDGFVLIIEHILPDDTHIWSAYWHVADLQVSTGQAVQLGQVIGRIHNRSYNSHLHWEVRAFGDGSELFPAGSAGEGCNDHAAGVGYTWDDDPERARPEVWGYLDPSEFIQAH